MKQVTRANNSDGEKMHSPIHHQSTFEKMALFSSWKIFSSRIHLAGRVTGASRVAFRASTMIGKCVSGNSGMN